MAGSLNKLRAVLDNNDKGTFLGLMRATYVEGGAIAANTATSIAVPTGANYVHITANVDFYANFTTTAVIPTTLTTDGSSSVLNPSMVGLDGCTSISVISAYAGVYTFEFFT